ncbi:unnamed protein product [Oncorhynchus mykiss]|uniref:Uncharacterized protein n=1 Tax=Oncorhynchus mykiss TaxID=8022 RepID=A0A060ZDU4_ONCMY|nr:unnamed protein product [Oncorhynchus mykiss]
MRTHHPTLPSTLLANVQSLVNEEDEIRARVAFQRDIRDCNMLCFEKTWLAVRTSNGIFSASRRQESTSLR